MSQLMPEKIMLEALPLFNGMTEAEQKMLMGIAVKCDFAAGEFIIRQGRTSQNLLIVLEGRCQVVRQTNAHPPKVVTLAELNPGDHFGEMSFFHPAAHSASVEAITDVQLLRIRHEDFQPLMDQGEAAAYKLGFNVLSKLAQRLRRMDDWVMELLSRKSTESNVSEWSNFRAKLFDGWK